MSQLLSRSCTPDTLPVMMAVKRFVDANVALFSAVNAADAQGLSTSVAHVLLIELPSHKAWRDAMTSVVPLMQAFVAQINITGTLVASVPQDKSLLLAGRLYEQGTSLLFEAFRVMHPHADHKTFLLGLLKERGVL